MILDIAFINVFLFFLTLLSFVEVWGGEMQKYGVVFLAVAVSGCGANFASIDRQSSLPNGGKAIHLDAPQRLMLVDKDGRTCAEPYPDALQAFATSMAAGASAPSYGAASGAGSFATAAGSIGLRTQSITLMRDAMYRLCEEARNGHVTNTDVISQIQRSQDLAMGLLAIEQLTGAVVAKQVVLTGSAGSSATASLVSAQNGVATLTSELSMLKQDREKARLAKVAAQAKYDAAKKKSDETKDPNEEQKKALAAELAAAQAALTKVSDEELRANEAVERGEAALSAAQRNLDKSIRDTNNAAATSATSAASTGGGFSEQRETSHISDKSAEHISKATKEIVDMVTSKGRISDHCLNIMSRYIDETDFGKIQRMALLVEQCKAVLNANITAYLHNNAGGLKADDGGNKPDQHASNDPNAQTPYETKKKPVTTPAPGTTSGAPVLPVTPVPGATTTPTTPAVPGTTTTQPTTPPTNSGTTPRVDASPSTTPLTNRRFPTTLGPALMMQSAPSEVLQRNANQPSAVPGPAGVIEVPSRAAIAPGQPR